VTHDLAALLAPHGVARSADLTRTVDRHTVGSWLATGRLVRPHRGVLVHPERADDWTTRALAAVLATDGVLSHVSALTVWRVAPEILPVHVSVPVPRSALRGPRLVGHRVDDVQPDRLGPFPVTDLPRALVDTWALAHARPAPPRAVQRARAAVISCLRDRRVTREATRVDVSARSSPSADLERVVCRRDDERSWRVPGRRAAVRVQGRPGNGDGPLPVRGTGRREP
jgi:hypothetical protein